MFNVHCSYFNVQLLGTEEEGFVVRVGVDSQQLIDFLIRNFGSKRQL